MLDLVNQFKFQIIGLFKLICKIPPIARSDRFDDLLLKMWAQQSLSLIENVIEDTFKLNNKNHYLCSSIREKKITPPRYCSNSYPSHPNSIIRIFCIKKTGVPLYFVLTYTQFQPFLTAPFRNVKFTILYKLLTQFTSYLLSNVLVKIYIFTI